MSVIGEMQAARNIRGTTGSKRYIEFDVLRSISMMLMVMAHAWENFSEFINADLYYYDHDWSFYTWSYAIIGPSLLMICLGTNLAFSRRNNPNVLIKRGISFLGIDIALNIVRFGLPAAVMAVLGRKEYLSFFLETLLCSDIYAFVGAFFIIYALLKKWNIGSFGLLILSLVMLAANTMLTASGLHINNEFISHFMGRFLWVDASSYFPLLPWMIFPTVGYCFAEYYQKLTEQEQNTFAYRMLIFCVIGAWAFEVTLTSYGISSTIASVALNDFKTDLLGTMLMILFAGIDFSAAHILVSRWPSSMFGKLCVKISKVIMPFYVIQWIIIAWAQFALEIAGAYNLFKTTASVTLTAIVITALSLYLALLYEANKGKIKAGLMKVCRRA